MKLSTEIEDAKFKIKNTESTLSDLRRELRSTKQEITKTLQKLDTAREHYKALVKTSTVDLKKPIPKSSEMRLEEAKTLLRRFHIPYYCDKRVRGRSLKPASYNLPKPVHTRLERLADKTEITPEVHPKGGRPYGGDLRFYFEGTI